jgi:hypothetical protein
MEKSTEWYNPKRKVYDNATVAHYWANQVQVSARNQQDNFYYHGQTIYSYGNHFPIAKIYGDVILFTYAKYSNTTAKHIHLTRGACSHKEVIYVRDVNANHQDNFAYWLSEINSVLVKIPKARNKTKYFEEAIDLSNNCKKYISLFKIKMPKDLAKVIKSLELGAESISEELKLKAKKENELIYGKGKKLYAKFLNDWRNGVPMGDILDSLKSYDGYKLLHKYKSASGITSIRLNGSDLETSKGVFTPRHIISHLLDKYSANLLKVGDKVIHYTITELHKDYIVIGCHKILAEEIDWLIKNINKNENTI